MQQNFRRRLLAMGRLPEGAARATQFDALRRAVGAAPVASRPYPDEVVDVLLATGMARGLTVQWSELLLPAPTQRR